MPDTRQNILPGRVRFALFSTSFTPLFLLIILRQVTDTWGDLRWAGITLDGVETFFRYYGISAGLSVISLTGSLFLFFTLQNLRRTIGNNGVPVQIVDVKNRNSESISYIGTYIIPFLFEDYRSLFSVLALIILLGVIYVIYVNSTLLLINPVLNLWYSLYEVEYFDVPFGQPLPNRSKNAMIVVSERLLAEGDRLLFQRVGHKLFFAEHVRTGTTNTRGPRRSDGGGGPESGPAVSDYS